MTICPIMFHFALVGEGVGTSVAAFDALVGACKVEGSRVGATVGAIEGNVSSEDEDEDPVMKKRTKTNTIKISSKMDTPPHPTPPPVA